MLKKLNEFTSKFFPALVLAMFSFLCMGLNIAEGATFWAWLMGIATLCWLDITRLALKKKGTSESGVKLTDGQEQRIKTATEEFHATMKEIELELVRAAKEKANVQSHQRKDQEAGREGTDGRTDSEEDRTP